MWLRATIDCLLAVIDGSWTEHVERGKVVPSLYIHHLRQLTVDAASRRPGPGQLKVAVLLQKGGACGRPQAMMC